MPVPRAVVRNPGRIIAQAKRTGMVILLHMLKRGDDVLPGLYRRSLNLWRDTWTESQRRKRESDLDYFIPICNVERYLRKNHHNMIFNTTAPYGNTEVKRVYSWDEGTIGPMNSLLNMAGARLRFLAMTRYPFPTPIDLTYDYTLRDGTVKTDSDYGYAGSSRSIKVILSHPALQPMDFVDMIRAPVSELCRQCFIHSVFGKVATPYISLLIYKLRPFLDYIYTRSRADTDNTSGTDGLVEKIDGILDEVLDRIRAQHGTRSGQLKRVTQEISEDILTGQVKLTFDDIIPENPTSKEYNELSKLVGKKVIDHRDFSRITRKVLTSSGGSGTRTHKRVSWGFPRPASASAAVLGGDFQTRLKEGYSLCANVPVWSGQGVADFVLYVRQRTLPEIESKSHAQGVWRPVMVLDLKSKSSFDLGIVGRALDTGNQIVTDDMIRKRRCSDAEWNTIIEHTPSKTELRQLDSYAKGIVSDFQRLTKDDSVASSTIIQGILVTDDTELPSAIRKHIQNLAISTYEQIQSELLTKTQQSPQKTSDQLTLPRRVYEIEGISSKKTRIAIVTEPLKVSHDVGITEALPYPSELPSLYSIELFTNRIPDSRHFVLYVSTRGSGTSESASWIARYWHGIEYARKTFLKRKHNHVLWLDLAGEFANPTIRRSFILRHTDNSPLYPREQNQRRYLREFLKKVDFDDLSDTIQGALLNGDEFPSVKYFEEKTQDYDMVIVSGMDTLWRILPPDIRGLLQTLTVSIAEATDEPDTTTIWFESAIPTSDTSNVYKQHRVRLLSYDSPLQVYVDEIILNHHIPPLIGISESPFVDEIRRIIRVTPEGYEILGLITIPPLRDWSKRFRSEILPERKKSDVYQKGAKDTKISDNILGIFEEKEMQDIISAHSFANSDVTLNLPKIKPEPILRYNLTMRELKKLSNVRSYKSVLSRIRLANELCDPVIFKKLSKRKETTKFHSLKSIKYRRKNWTPRLQLETSKISSLPPYESRLTFEKLTLKEAGKTEIDRFLEAVTVLGQTTKLSVASIKEFLRDMMDRFTKAQFEIGSSDSLLADEISEALKYIGYSKSIWWGLSYPRSDLFEWKLPPAVRDALKQLQQKNPSFLHRYGNYFMMLLSYFQNRRGEFTLEQLEKLWNAFRPWIMMQLGGVQSQNDIPKARFNMQKVFSDLKERIEYMDRLPCSEIPIFDDIRYGITADSHELDEGEWPLYRWHIFEKTPFSKELIAGCVKITKKEMEKQTIIPLDEQVEKAADSFSSELIRPIIIAKTSGISVLYEPTRDDGYHFYNSDDLDHADFEWSAIGQLRYGTRHVGALARLRWVSTSYYAQFPELQSESLPRRPTDTVQNLLEHLDKIANELSNVERVTVTVSGTSDNGVIAFVDSDGDECGTLGFDRLSRATRILRTPYDQGQPLVLGRTLVTWNPTQNISYSSKLSQLEQDVLKGIL